MPHINLTPIEEARGELKQLYENIQRVRGPRRVSNLFKGYGSRACPAFRAVRGSAIGRTSA